MIFYYLGTGRIVGCPFHPHDSGSFCYKQSKAELCCQPFIPLVLMERFLWVSHCTLGSQRQSEFVTHSENVSWRGIGICVSKFKEAPTCSERGSEKVCSPVEGLEGLLWHRACSANSGSFPQVGLNMKPLWSCGWGTRGGWWTHSLELIKKWAWVGLWGSSAVPMWYSRGSTHCSRWRELPWHCPSLGIWPANGSDTLDLSFLI